VLWVWMVCTQMRIFGAGYTSVGAGSGCGEVVTLWGLGFCGGRKLMCVFSWRQISMLSMLIDIGVTTSTRSSLFTEE
jgi:hypothetical protein